MSLERPRIRPEINVTPLVDVVLVLLIICMVITPQMEGPSVDLASARNADAEDKARAQKADAIVLVLQANGDVFLGPDPVAADALPARIASERTRRPGARVVIKADRAAPFGKVRALYSVCQKAGLTAVSLKIGDAVGPETRGT